MEENNILIEVKSLSLAFDGKRVLDNISFEIQKGESLGIVGESGSGKSVTSLAIMGLLANNAEILSGEVLFHQEGETTDLLEISNKEHQKFRGNEISMIFQEPMTALNPSITCGKQVLEILELHKPELEDKKSQVISLFSKVLLPDPERIFKAYPHELSGGQKQRVMIAMAIACEPKLLIADEPTTALDVTVQKTILELLRDLQKDLGMAMIFISHDLGVIAEVSDKVTVMYRGKVVETGLVNDLFNNPKEDYTKGLISCKPRMDVRLKRLPTVSDFTENTGFEPEEFSKEERDTFHKEIYNNPPLLEVNGLSKYFSKSSVFGKTKTVKAVNDINFKLYEGETLGLVGESGSGKTTLSRTLLQLEKATEGEIIYKGKDLTKLSKKEMRALRKEIQIIFQDPYSSLNGRHTIERILIEPMKIHGVGNSKAERIERAEELLERVGLTKEALKKYPHEFSGGQRQRIGIARAIGLEPKFIICDESVSALDVSVQAQVLNLLNELKEEFGFTYIFISHDLSVVKYMSDNLLVLKSGNLEEFGDADAVYKNPQKEYTKNLIEAIPKM